MADELDKKIEQEQLEEVTEEAVVEEPIKEEDTTEEKEETKEEASEVQKDSADVEEKVIEEESADEKEEREPAAKETEIEEESKAEDVVEETVEASSDDEIKEPVEEKVEEVVKDEPSIAVDDVKKQLAEKEAELAEEKAIKSYEDDVREANRQLDQFLLNLGSAMEQELAKYGIGVDVSLDELRKSDPAKAQVAENIINQAQAVKAQALKNVQRNLNDKLTDVVFNKASRLFDKYELTSEQATVAAETFINILTQTGIKDVGDDLIAKVELAAARAKMIKPKVEKIVEDTKEVIEDTAKAVKDVIEEKANKEEAKEDEIKKEEVEEEKQENSSVVETPNIDEFKEGAVTSNQAAGDAITIDNALQKMASLPFKERTVFYAQNKEICEAAMARQSEAESKRKRI